MIMSCQYLEATDQSNLEEKIQGLAINGPFISTEFRSSGNMICKQGLMSFIHNINISYIFYVNVSIISERENKKNNY